MLVRHHWNKGPFSLAARQRISSRSRRGCSVYTWANDSRNSILNLLTEILWSRLTNNSINNATLISWHSEEIPQKTKLDVLYLQNGSGWEEWMKFITLLLFSGSRRVNDKNARLSFDVLPRHVTGQGAERFHSFKVEIWAEATGWACSAPRKLVLPRAFQEWHSSRKKNGINVDGGTANWPMYWQTTSFSRCSQKRRLSSKELCTE